MIAVFYAVMACSRFFGRSTASFAGCACLAEVSCRFLDCGSGLRIDPGYSLREYRADLWSSEFRGQSRSTLSRLRFRLCISLHFSVFSQSRCGFSIPLHRLRRIANVIVIFGFCYAFFAILQSVLSPDKIYGIYETRFAVPFGSFVSRHNFAAYMEMTIAMPLGLILSGAVRPDKRLLYFTAIGSDGSGIAPERFAGWIGRTGCGNDPIVILLTTGRRAAGKLRSRLLFLLSLLAAVVGGAILVGGETSLTRIAETTTAGDVTTGRSTIWHVAATIIAANFPFGAGLGSFGVAYTPFDTLSGLERVEQAHNDYLQVLTDAGLVGLVIGAFFLVVLIREGIGATRLENTYRRGLAIGAFAGSLRSWCTAFSTSCFIRRRLPYCFLCYFDSYGEPKQF